MISTTFKRIPVGTKFTCRLGVFRKASSSGAYRIKPSGIGETHAIVPFTRSSHVLILS